MRFRAYPLKLYIRKLPIIVFGLIAIVLNIFSWLWISFQIPYTDESLFLHYNILFGVDAIGEGWRIFFVPLVGLIILIINIVIGWLVYRKDHFISQLLVASAAFCQVFVVIATILLVFLNV